MQCSAAARQNPDDNRVQAVQLPGNTAIETHGALQGLRKKGCNAQVAVRFDTINADNTPLFSTCLPAAGMFQVTRDNADWEGSQRGRTRGR